MIDGQTKADALNAVALLRATEAAGERAARASAKQLAAEQGRLIEQGATPDGGRQKQNAPSTITRHKKGNKPPLWNTGRLKDPKAWRVRKNSDEYKITLLPPRDRGQALAINHARGYDTILTQGIPPEFVERVKANLEKEMKKVPNEARPKEK